MGNVNNVDYPLIYASWSKNESNRFYSTSGGVFGEIAKYFLINGGVVVGAMYNRDNLLVEHAIIDNINDLYKIQQSKYLSSSIGDIFIQVKKILLKGKKVLFSGAPCQVAGLKCYLNKEYSGLTTVDFICRGMNSPKAYKAWLNEIEFNESKRISNVWFKYKDGGWNSSPLRTKVEFSDGSFKIFDSKNNLYMYAYLNFNLYIRPSCSKCMFKGARRYSDITLADFWGISSELNDNKGTSLIMINNKNGEDILSFIKENIEIYKQEFKCENNPMFDKSVIIHKNSKKFLKDLDKIPFSKALKKYHCLPHENVVLKLLVKINKWRKKWKKIQ